MPTLARVKLATQCRSFQANMYSFAFLARSIAQHGRGFHWGDQLERCRDGFHFRRSFYCCNVICERIGWLRKRQEENAHRRDTPKRYSVNQATELILGRGARAHETCKSRQ